MIGNTKKIKIGTDIRNGFNNFFVLGKKGNASKIKSP
jgi:hypothetical protein